jgi:hypothetical protein
MGAFMESMEITLFAGAATTFLLGGWGLICLVLPRYVPKALNQEKLSSKQLRWLGVILIIVAIAASRVIVVPYLNMWRAGEL